MGTIFTCQNVMFKDGPRAERVNPYPAELFVSIFLSFEAGIADVIFSFK